MALDHGPGAAGQGDAFPTRRYRIFAQRLERSYTAVEYFAQILRECGFIDVYVAPIVRDAEGNVMGGVTDGGDIWFTDPFDGERHRIEVKHQPTLLFTGGRDWPYRNYVVCNTEPWDRAEQKPIAVFRLNGAMTHFGCVPGETRLRWTEGWQRDGKKGTLEWCYFAPFACVIWGEL